MLHFSSRFSTSSRQAAALNFWSFPASAKNTPMPFDPQKTMLFMIFRYFMLHRAHGTHTKSKRKPNPKPGPKKRTNTNKNASFRLFRAFCRRIIQKKHQNSLPVPFPPPGAPLNAKETQRTTQEAPKPPQEPPRSAARAVWAAISRPTAAHFGLLGGRF